MLYFCHVKKKPVESLEVQCYVHSLVVLQRGGIKNHQMDSRSLNNYIQTAKFIYINMRRMYCRWVYNY